MPSEHESFWDRDSFVVIGHDAKKPFPRLTFAALVARGKTVYAVDPSVDEIDGHRAHSDLDGLPEPGAMAAVLEVPREETAEWISRIAAAGIRDVWIHMGRETSEALALARGLGLKVCHGTCAVQYLDKSFPHSIHAWIRRVMGKY